MMNSNQTKTPFNELFKMLDQARAVGLDLELPIPTIVVVGEQSSAKSSLLETISGVPLPRGQNLTTRCPLIMRIVPSVNSYMEITLNLDDDKDNDTNKEQKKETFMSWSNIPKRVAQLTEQLTGNVDDLTISDKPIYLTIYLRNMVSSLTIIDLPGLTRNPVGNQPQNIHSILQNMILKYISQPQTLILNVVPCTMDLSTSESLALSRQVDPHGKRTLCVISKMDLAEPGIQARLNCSIQQLSMSPESLFLVRTNIYNATEIQSINTSEEFNKEWHAALLAEDTFFQRNAELEGCKFVLGTKALTARLMELQNQQIRTILPELKVKIRQILRENHQKINNILPSFTDARNLAIFLEKHVQTYVQYVMQAARGESVSIGFNKKIDTHLPSSLQQHQEKLFGDMRQEILTAIHPFHPAFLQQAKEALHFSCGLQLPNFVTGQAVRHIVHDLCLSSWNTLGKRIIDLASKDLKSTLLSILADTLPDANSKCELLLNTIVERFVEHQTESISEHLDSLLESEQDVYTNHPYYLDLVKKLRILCQMQGNNNISKDTSMIIKPKLHNRAVSFQDQLNYSSETKDNNNNNNNNKPLAPCHFVVNDIELNPEPQHMLTFREKPPTEEVLELAISSFAYIIVAYQRFCDQLGLALRQYFLHSLSRVNCCPGLLPFLVKEVRNLCEKELNLILVESPETKTRRELLEKRDSILEPLENMLTHELAF